MSKLVLEHDEDGFFCDAVGHWFRNKQEGEDFLSYLEKRIDSIVGSENWDTIKGKTTRKEKSALGSGYKVYKGDVLVGVYPINTKLDSFINGI